MSIFSSILGKIFPSNHPATAAAASTAPAGATASPLMSATNMTAPMPPVDVMSILSGMAQKNSEKLNWQSSIVDLMKLLGLESSLTARKELAKELHFSGDMNDSAAMNTWLQKQVMQKLADNGGMVPAELRA